MKPIILLVDDNPKLLAGIKTRLELEGFQVITADDGASALQVLESVAPHLIIADIMMPRMDGWQLFERVRAMPRLTAVPFLFLTALTHDTAIQRGKELGAEDFLTKPFKSDELVASIRGKLRRAAELAQIAQTHTQDPNAVLLTIDDLTIDLSARRVTRNGAEISLTPTEFRLFAFLAQRAGIVCAIEDLARAAYANDTDEWDATAALRAHIKNLRKKIERVDAPPHIVNVHSVGYRLEST